MTRIPDLERALHEAARRLEVPAIAQEPVRRPRRWRLPVLAAVSTLTIAGGAIAATGILQEGDPVPSSPRFASTLGDITPGSTRLLSLRAADPEGGLPWALRVFRTRDGRLACTQVGRTQNGQLGAIGIHGAFDDDGRFHRVPVTSVQNMSCGGLSRDGELRISGSTKLSASGGAVLTINDSNPSETRVVRFGFGGPGAVRFDLHAGPYSRSVPVSKNDGGAYLVVSDGKIEREDVTSEVVYDDGTRCSQELPRPGAPTPRVNARCNR